MNISSNNADEVVFKMSTLQCFNSLQLWDYLMEMVFWSLFNEIISVAGIKFHINSINWKMNFTY